MTWRRASACTPAQFTAPLFSPLSRIEAVEYFGLANTPKFITVLDAMCVPSGSNTTGAVALGYKKVSSPLLGVRIEEGNDYIDGRRWYSLKCRTSRGTECKLGWDPNADDLLEYIIPGNQLFFLRFCEVITLILVKDKQDIETFYRIRISNDTANDFLNKAEKRIITIR
jgi:hypothetical protein